jgi:flagellin
MRSQIRGMNMASSNAQNAISLIQTAEGAMQSVHNILQKKRELAVQAANGINDPEVDLVALNTEFQSLSDEISQIQTTIKFNDMDIFGQTFTIQSGANAGDVMTFTVGNLPDLSGANMSLVNNASGAITALDDIINNVSLSRAELGATQNRLEFKIQNLDNSAENLAAAESRIRDVDIAREMTEFAKNNLLFQASAAMLAQANAIPDHVLHLLMPTGS